MPMYSQQRYRPCWKIDHVFLRTLLDALSTPCFSFGLEILEMHVGLPRERETSKYPHFFVGTLQPQQADWKGRPRCVFCFSLVNNVLRLTSPRENSPGPHMKDVLHLESPIGSPPKHGSSKDVHVSKMERRLKSCGISIPLTPPQANHGWMQS